MVRTKYYRYESGQSVIAIPIKFAKDLELEHLDELEIETRVIDGIKRLILTRVKDVA